MLEGLNKPDAGMISVLGLDPTRNASQLKQRIGVQLQTAALYPNLTVSELITLFGSFYDHARPTNPLLTEFGLDERSHGLTKELSGGQRQRLSVALAMVNEPELIFLDEPTTGLDPQARHSLWEQIEGLRGQGRTVLLTTHYMEEAERLCDRVAIMDHGKILEIGTVEELVGRQFHERTVRFDDAPGARRRATRAAAAGHRVCARERRDRAVHTGRRRPRSPRCCAAAAPAPSPNWPFVDPRWRTSSSS